jgi:hypothetical protein
MLVLYSFRLSCWMGRGTAALHAMAPPFHLLVLLRVELVQCCQGCLG